jgi:periplasmic divalent cation tolerance protein
MSQPLIVFTTAPTREGAIRIAGALVERRLAACVQVSGPITSVYCWQGMTENAAEWLCLVKTRQERYDEVERTIRELHSYETPEIVATPIVAGSPAYLQWLNDETM